MASCDKCKDTGVIETGNNDFPCNCSTGDATLFNVTNVVGPVTGVEIKKHFLNNSPEPLVLGPEPVLASNLPDREEKLLQESNNLLDKFPVMVQLWEESERGWGTRPDGYSLHLTEEARKSYIEDYWASMPDEVPDEYSRPCGSPYVASVNEKTFIKVSANKNGIKLNGNPSQ